MISTCKSFGSPFLLEVGSICVLGQFGTRKIVEIVFIPGLSDFLNGKLETLLMEELCYLYLPVV